MTRLAFLAAALIGVLFGWDAIPTRPALLTFAIAGALLATTHAALWVADPKQPLWEASALVLPTLCDGFGMVVSDALANGLPAILPAAATGRSVVRCLHQRSERADP